MQQGRDRVETASDGWGVGGRWALINLEEMWVRLDEGHVTTILNGFPRQRVMSGSTTMTAGESCSLDSSHSQYLMSFCWAAKDLR